MKIAGKIFLLCIVTFSFGAEAFFKPKSINEGDRATLVLIAQGKKIDFPKIDAIDGFEVVSQNQSQNIQNINGNVKSYMQKELSFYPNHDVKLEGLEVIVDGKTETIEPIYLRVQPMDRKNAPYSFSMKVSNENPYKNESVELEFEFKFKRDLRIVDLRFTPPQLKNFWLKEGKKSQPIVDGDFVIQKISYLLFPQKSGEIKIVPAGLDIGLEEVRQDNFGLFSRGASYKRVSSNPLTLNVKDLKSVNYVGDFQVDLEIDKNEINSNESVNATLKISGNGNFDDFMDISLQTSANVFADKPEVKTQVVADKLQGTFVKKFSLSANESFEIKPFVLEYFSKKDRVIKTIKTKAFKIKVNRINKEETLFVNSNEKKENKVVIQKENNYLLFLYGLIVGVMISIVLFFVFKYRKLFTFSKRKSEKEMLKALYKIEDEKAKEYMREIEEYLYGKADTLHNRKEIGKFIKSYEE